MRKVTPGNVKSSILYGSAINNICIDIIVTTLNIHITKNAEITTLIGLWRK